MGRLCRGLEGSAGIGWLVWPGCKFTSGYTLVTGKFTGCLVPPPFTTPDAEFCVRILYFYDDSSGRADPR